MRLIAEAMLWFVAAAIVLVFWAGVWFGVGELVLG